MSDWKKYEKERAKILKERFKKRIIIERFWKTKWREVKGKFKKKEKRNLKEDLFKNKR